jgi:hypothetical protein
MKIIAAALATIIATGASAQNQNCGPAVDLLQRLQGEYGEYATMRGLMESGDLLFIFANPETGSWSAVTASPTGIACLRAFGEAYEPMAVPAPGEDM